MDEGRDEKPRRKLWAKITPWAVSLLVIGFAIGLVLAPSPQATTYLPVHIKNKLNFPVFLPKTLPSHFSISENSFTLDEDTLLFSAENKTGQTIVFSEQQKPVGFNFDSFYQEHIKEARTVDNTPFPTIAGKSPAQQNAEVVSVVTDKTWVIISSNTVSRDQLQDIARNLKQY